MKNILFVFLLFYPFVSYSKNFYLNVNIAGNKVSSFKQYSNVSPEINIGIGYYFNDYYRVSILNGYSNFNFDNKYIPYEEVVDTSATVGTKCINHKTQVKYIMLNNYVNLIRKDNFELYISAGIGIDKIKEQSTYLFSGLLINGDIVSVPLTTAHHNSKNTRNFIYSIGTGVGIKLNPDINLDLAYNYKDFGIPKYESENLLLDKRYKLHSFSVGIRLDL